jgi:hypothetical protein
VNVFYEILGTLMKRKSSLRQIFDRAEIYCGLHVACQAPPRQVSLGSFDVTLSFKAPFTLNLFNVT